jgi:hypothetical protein
MKNFSYHHTFLMNIYLTCIIHLHYRYITETLHLQYITLQYIHLQNLKVLLHDIARYRYDILYRYLIVSENRLLRYIFATLIYIFYFFNINNMNLV